MPKDAKKNIGRYQIRGGDLNEFEFQKNQARVKESSTPEHPMVPGEAIGNTEPVKSVQGATSKKLAVKKSVAKGSATKKAAPSKTTAKRSAPKKGSKKKATAKKMTAKKATAKKSAAKKKTKK